MKKDFDPNCITPNQISMIFNARLFRRRQTVWNRVYLISRYEGIGTAEDAFGRLYIENSNFGDQLQILFGRIDANRYSQLLNEFSVGMREMIGSQLRGDAEAMNRAVEQLYRNAEVRAAFLASINPYLDREQWEAMLKEYLHLTIEEANSFASHNYQRDIEIHDKLIALSDRMGYAFAESLYNHITSGGQCTYNLPPNQCLTVDEMNAIYGIRMLWFEIVTWARAYMLSRIENIGNAEAVYARFELVADEFGDVMTRLFGEEAGEYEERHIDQLIALLDALITGQLEGNVEQVNESTRGLYQLAHEIAEFLASINPFWDAAAWGVILYDIVRNLIDASTTLLAGNYAIHLGITSTLMDQAEVASSYFAQGLYQYAVERGFPDGI